MNERIKELALQAGVTGYFAAGTKLATPIPLSPEMQKFAELIVRECLKEIIRQNHNIASNQWEEGYEAGFQTAATVILKHFGVEE